MHDAAQLTTLDADEEGRFRCYLCKRAIGKRSRTHNLMENARIVCNECRLAESKHAVLFPDCDIDWHDLYHHSALSNATNADIKRCNIGEVTGRLRRENIERCVLHRSWKQHP